MANTNFQIHICNHKQINKTLLIPALTKNFKTSRLFPVLWVEESIELNDELVNMIKSDLINTLKLVDVLQWTFVGIGAALIVGMLIWFFIARRKRVTKTTSVDPMISPKE